MEHAVSMSMMGHQSISLAWLSEAYLLAGRVDDALSLAERALHLSRTHKEQGNEAWALRLLGEIAAHHDPGNPAKAEDYYRQAMGLANQLEMRPRICAVGHGGQVLFSDTTHALVAKDLPAGVSLRDLGEHRLRAGVRDEELVTLGNVTAVAERRRGRRCTGLP